MKQVYIVFCDGEVQKCYLDHIEAEAALDFFVENDPEQDHTWSLTPFELLGDIT